MSPDVGRFELLETRLAGLQVLRRKPIGDARGFFERVFCVDDLGGLLGGRTIQQVNRTLTETKGTVRGLHFQRPPHAEMKLVSCLRGRIFDVAVDLRKDSPTFLQWHGEILSAENARTLAIPEGFAHGFQTLEPDCELLYFHTASYHPEAEDGVDALDPRLEIEWPEPIAERSERDQKLATIDESFAGLEC